MRSLKVFSNVARFETATHPELRLDHRTLGPTEGWGDVWRDYLRARAADVVVVNTDVSRLLRFCILSFVVPRRFRLVSLDIVLAPPRSWKARLVTAVKKLCFRKVDRFIVYQHDLAGYGQYYGITPDRSDVIAFKVNLWERLQRETIPTADNGQLLFVGRTFRDVPTFLQAVELSGVPAMMVRHSGDIAAAHGTTFGDGTRPANLTEVVHDAGRDSWVQLIAEARGVVLPIQPGTINCAGISTLYDAMALGKPVVISDCPATRGIVTDEDVALVPAGDARALAEAMRRVSCDAAYRERLVERGHEIVERTGGEARLYNDILRIVADVAGPATR